jgi:hypothetical protein
MLDQALRTDLGHDLVGIVDALAALKSQRLGKRLIPKAPLVDSRGGLNEAASAA